MTNTKELINSAKELERKISLVIEFAPESTKRGLRELRKEVKIHTQLIKDHAADSVTFDANTIREKIQDSVDINPDDNRSRTKIKEWDVNPEPYTLEDIISNIRKRRKLAQK